MFQFRFVVENKTSILQELPVVALYPSVTHLLFRLPANRHIVISDWWNCQWQLKTRPPSKIKEVVGSWCGEVIFSQPFCLYYLAFWNEVGGVGARGQAPYSLFDHWSPWPHLKGLNLSVDLFKDFFEEGLQGSMLTGIHHESGDAVEKLRGVVHFSTWVEMEGCTESGGCVNPHVLTSLIKCRSLHTL